MSWHSDYIIGYFPTAYCLVVYYYLYLSHLHVFLFSCFSVLCVWFQCQINKRYPHVSFQDLCSATRLYHLWLTKLILHRQTEILLKRVQWWPESNHHLFNWARDGTSKFWTIEMVNRCNTSDKQLQQRFLQHLLQYWTAVLNIQTRAQLSLGLADHAHGAHSQPASITVRVWCFEHVVACARNVNVAYT